MSDCEKCERNALHGCCSCEQSFPQVSTDKGIRSKILLCPGFAQSARFDFAVRDQVGSVL